MSTATEPVTVYWRPGCGFCSSLFRGLDERELPYARINIWEDEDGAAFVRSVANGNETVPTVRIGHSALVNPSTTEVLRTVAEEAPGDLPDGYEPPDPGRLSRFVGRLFGDQPDGP